ncbi:molybdopterin cofactor-binding domain-containing protein, partial [Litorivivens sp.]
MTRLNKGEDIQHSRRQFLVGSVGAGLVMAFAPAFTQYGSLLASEKIEKKLFNPTIWFEINQSGDILVNVTRAEMGQHVGTALARIVADELGADWNRVSIKHVDTDPKWGYMVTGGSWSVFQSFMPMS